jgi:serine phosphatase RsbU (regulator of sigma subunit)
VAAAVDDEHLAVLRELGLHSSVVVPLVARNRMLGAVSLISSESRRTYTPSDLAFIEDVARRAATAIDNARLYQERSHVARALQHALLPPDLPVLPGLDLAATYRPISELSESGGDFYDVFESADGSWTIAVGDVEGKGPEAAAVTGLARHTIRAAAVRERSPARILELLNEVLVHDREVPRFCTVALGTVRTSTDGTDITIASGGHPPPLVLRRDGSVEPVRLTGSLLGAFDDPPFAEASVSLGQGDALVIYTDGVTETRRDREPFGDERLATTLAACAGRTAKAVADSIEGAVVAWQPEHREDDLAILVVRVEPEA